MDSVVALDFWYIKNYFIISLIFILIGIYFSIYYDDKNFNLNINNISNLTKILSIFFIFFWLIYIILIKFNILCLDKIYCQGDDDSSTYSNVDPKSTPVRIVNRVNDGAITIINENITGNKQGGVEIVNTYGKGFSVTNKNIDTTKIVETKKFATSGEVEATTSKNLNLSKEEDSNVKGKGKGKSKLFNKIRKIGSQLLTPKNSNSSSASFSTNSSSNITSSSANSNKASSSKLFINSNVGNSYASSSNSKLFTDSNAASSSNSKFLAIPHSKENLLFKKGNYLKDSKSDSYLPLMGNRIDDSQNIFIDSLPFDQYKTIAPDDIVSKVERQFKKYRFFFDILK
jgi:hypothetical protein